MNNELPDPWGSELSSKGIHSYRQFAAAMGDGIGHETLRRLVTGGKTSPSTVNKVADKLFGGDRTKVWQLYGINVEDHGDWTLPAEASLLSEQQRDAIKMVLKAMLPDLSATTRSNPDAQKPIPTIQSDDVDPAIAAAFADENSKIAQQRKTSETPKDVKGSTGKSA